MLDSTTGLQLVCPQPQWRGILQPAGHLKESNPEHRVNGAHWMWDEEEEKLVPDRDTWEADLDL